MAVAIGQPAPPFTLKDQDGTEVSLEDFAGETAVALVFYPFAFSGICEGELCQLREDLETFRDSGVQVLAVSCDSAQVQKAWAEQKGWNFPVLSDFWPHGEVARAYGVFNEAVGCANRATVFVGADGTIKDAFETDNLGTAREADRYAEALVRL